LIHLSHPIEWWRPSKFLGFLLLAPRAVVGSQLRQPSISSAFDDLWLREVHGRIFLPSIKRARANGVMARDFGIGKPPIFFALNESFEPTMICLQLVKPALNEFKKFGHGYTTSKMHSARRERRVSNWSVSLQSGFTRPRDAAARIGLYNSNFEPLRQQRCRTYPDVTGHYGVPPLIQV
jgi:hypothetical protein